MHTFPSHACPPTHTHVKKKKWQLTASVLCLQESLISMFKFITTAGENNCHLPGSHWSAEKKDQLIKHVVEQLHTKAVPGDVWWVPCCK